MKENHARIIFHIDMNAFFCSVACILNPALRGTVFAIGRENTYKGVIATASYEARALGIHSAMALVDAYHICPTLNVVHVDYSVYEEYHNRFVGLVREYTKLIEVASIDELYADMTEISKVKHPLVIAREIQSRLLKDYNLPCSIGIAPTLFLAKMGSDMKKPLGLTVVRKREVETVLYPLSVKDIYGIGKKTYPVLIDAGIKTIGDIMNPSNKDLVIELIGENAYQYVVNHVRGNSTNIVDPDRYAKNQSISTSWTYDINKRSLTEILYELRSMTRGLVAKLKDDGYFAKTVGITLRDSSFATITRQHALEDYSDDFDLIMDEITDLASESVVEGKEYRLVGASLSGLVKSEELPKEYNIFNVNDVMKKEIIIDEMIHNFQAKYGENALFRKKKEKD